MRKFFIIQALFWGVGLYLSAQDSLSVSVGEPIVSYKNNKYAAVTVSDTIHAVEGSSATYKITVTRADLIDRVISLTYNDNVINDYELNNDITISELSANKEPLEFKIELKVKKTDGKDTTLTASSPLKIKVWSEPKEPKLNFGSNSDTKAEKNFLGKSWDLKVINTEGGFTNGWKIKWEEADNNVVDETSYTVTSSTTDKIENKHIQLHVTNLAPDHQTTWYDKSYDYYVRFYPVPNVKFVSSYPSNVINGETISMEVRLADNTERSEDYSLSYNWGNGYVSSSSYTFTASNNGTDENKDSVSVNCKVQLKDTELASETGSLSYTFTVWPTPSVNLSEGPYTSDKQKLLFQDGKLQITAGTNGGFRDGWSFEWKDKSDNDKVLSTETVYTIKCDAKGERPIDKHVALTVKNQAEGRDKLWLEKSYDYYVRFYPTPIVKFDKIYPKNIQNDSIVKMAIVIQDANGTPSDDYALKCSWPDKSNDSTYEFTGNNESDYDGVQDTITVIVEANLNGTELTHKDNLSYVITTWPNSVVKSDGLTNYVGCGGQTKDFYVTSTGGRKDGWTYEWYKNGTIIGQGSPTFTLDLENDDVNSEPITDSDSVRVKNISDGEEWFSEVYPFSVTIYPKPRVPDTITLTDGNRGQEITKGIREGNDIGLYCDECLGGYPDAWTYSWNCDNREIGAERQLDTNVSANYTGSGKANTDVTYSCYVQNLYKGSSWEEKRYDKTITVYRKPQTPTGLTRKGNGTSGTLIATTSVSDTDLEGHEYYLVFGYIDANGQMHDAMSQRQQNVGEVRWSTQISSSEMNSPSNTLYVYALWKYSDGAEITSGLRQLNSVDERWDGSSYDGSTRSVIANATAISNIQHGEDAITPHEYYMTNGMKSQGQSKGLNIIRMSDGTVKKMMVK